MSDTVSTLVPELVELGDSCGNEYEQIPFALVKRIILAGRRESGILALFIGAANWGVKDFPKDLKVPDDPAGDDWKGTSKRSGKHCKDSGRKGYMSGSRPMGGFGIPHADSSFLQRDIYGKWGKPDIGSHTDLSFDQLMDYGEGKYRDEWLDWATPLLDNMEVQIWLVNFWLDKYWKPATDTYPGLRECAVNARISNSVSGVASKIRDGFLCECTGKPDEGKYRWVDIKRHLTVEEQIDSYCAYKLAKRGESAAERSLRQANQALRVGELVDLVGFTPL